MPEWCRKRSDCSLKRKPILENFPNYISKSSILKSENFQETKNIPSDILIELQEIRFKKLLDRASIM